MPSFLYDIGDRNRAVARFISHVNDELKTALIHEKKERKLTQQAIAETLGVNRSVVNRRFMGLENMTLKSVAELAWALGWKIKFSLEKKKASHAGENEPLGTDTFANSSLTLGNGKAITRSSTDRRAIYTPEVT